MTRNVVSPALFKRSTSHNFVRLLAPRASSPCILHQPQSWDNHSIVHCSILAPCSTRVRFYFAHFVSASSSTPFHDGTRTFAFIIPETERCPFYATNCFTQHANHSLLYSNYRPLAQMPLIQFLTYVSPLMNGLNRLRVFGTRVTPSQFHERALFVRLWASLYSSYRSITATR